MQAPILLSTGAIARYALERRLRYATRRITFADFSQQTAAHLADDLGAWQLNLDLLTDAEASDWIDFYRSVQGGAAPFTFLDPWDNLLKHSEAFENAVWSKSSGLHIGKNYLLRSEEFNSGSWNKAGTPSAPVVTADSVAAPDGTTTADKIDFPATGAGEQSFIDQNVFSAVPSVPSKKFTASIFLRADSAITIRLQIGDGVDGFNTTLNLTTSWQRFSHTATVGAGATGLLFQIVNPASQAAKTVYAWGAQIEYGGAASDYTKTTTAATELLIADPFWIAAGGSTPGASFGLNSNMEKRARQIVITDATNPTLGQLFDIAPGGSGSNRVHGLSFTGTIYVKRQDASPPTFPWQINNPNFYGDFSDIGTQNSPITPSVSWERKRRSVRFKAGAFGTQTRIHIGGSGTSAIGTFYLFGAQMEAASTESKYKKTAAKSGVRPNCRFAEDEIEHAATQFDHNNLSQLVIQEWNG